MIPIHGKTMPDTANEEKSQSWKINRAIDQKTWGRYKTNGENAVGNTHAIPTKSSNMEKLILTIGVKIKFSKSDQPDKYPNAFKRIGTVATVALQVTQTIPTHALTILCFTVKG